MANHAEIEAAYDRIEAERGGMVTIGPEGVKSVIEEVARELGMNMRDVSDALLSRWAMQGGG